MRIIISAGGTGGGVYPAFAAAEALQSLDTTDAPIRLYFLGGQGVGGMEPELIARSGIRWERAAYILGGPVHGVSPLRMLTSAVRLAIGLVQAIVFMLRVRPQAVLVTGGWASLPVALAAWLGRVPVYGFVPDIEPALTLKVVGRFARRMLATVPETQEFFPPGLVLATGYPLRATVKQATRDAAIAHFGLNPDCQTLLVTGGSSGARSINRAVIGILPDLMQDEKLQVIHISGKLDRAEVQAVRDTLPPATRARYHAYDYLHEDMGLALAAADLVVSRAGASTLGEFPYFGLPAVLVPYPYAWRYQRVNADYLAARGAGIRLDDAALPEVLYPTLRDLLDDPAQLVAMRTAARALIAPGADGAPMDGALAIARQLVTGPG
jgi:UDP-N-acetylglucosamine--N-acetylmuramyl-(pentapeptide) pyrophosphoryl-undecaprenol N-acetylglucosamine transferase